MFSELDLEPKGQGHSRNKKTMTLETTKHAIKKIQNILHNWLTSNLDTY